VTERRPQTESELIEHLRALELGAPAALHERVEALLSTRSTLKPGRAQPSPLAWRFAAAGAMALAAIAVALFLSHAHEGSPPPSLQAAAAVALAQPTLAPPAESSSNRAQLTARVDGVAFPYWEEGLGWRSVGSRSDRVGARTVTTVFYADPRGRRIGYAILDGIPAPALAGGVLFRREGTVYHLLRLDGANAIVWLRRGHLCVVAGHGVDGATLLRLASWDEGPRSA
jgi:hypothetical protein